MIGLPRKFPIDAPLPVPGFVYVTATRVGDERTSGDPDAAFADVTDAMKSCDSPDRGRYYGWHEERGTLRPPARMWVATHAFLDGDVREVEDGTDFPQVFGFPVTPPTVEVGPVTIVFDGPKGENQ